LEKTNSRNLSGTATAMGRSGISGNKLCAGGLGKGKTGKNA